MKRRGEVEIHKEYFSKIKNIFSNLYRIVHCLVFKRLWCPSYGLEIM